MTIGIWEIWGGKKQGKKDQRKKNGFLFPGIRKEENK